LKKKKLLNTLFICSSPLDYTRKFYN